MLYEVITITALSLWRSFPVIARNSAVIRSRLKGIEARMLDIGNLNKFHSGVHAGKIEGAMIGLTVTISLLGLLLLGR